MPTKEETPRRRALYAALAVSPDVPTNCRSTTAGFAIVVVQASTSEIESAFRQLALIYHPDRHHAFSDDAKAMARARFIEINAAYRPLLALRTSRSTSPGVSERLPCVGHTRPE